MWGGERIRHLRRRLGWSAADFSRRLGCSTEILQRIEGDELEIDTDMVHQLEVLELQLESYVDVVRRAPQADQQMQEEGHSQIHKNDLK